MSSVSSESTDVRVSVTTSTSIVTTTFQTTVTASASSKSDELTVADGIAVGIGASLGGVLLLAICGFIFFCTYRRRRRQRNRQAQAREPERQGEPQSFTRMGVRVTPFADPDLIEKANAEQRATPTGSGRQRVEPFPHVLPPNRSTGQTTSEARIEKRALLAASQASTSSSPNAQSTSFPRDRKRPLAGSDTS